MALAPPLNETNEQSQVVSVASPPSIKRRTNPPPPSWKPGGGTAYHTVNPIDDDDLTFDATSLDFSHEIGTILKCWNTVLGVSAVLDFLAATVDSHLRRYLEFETEHFDPWLRRNAWELGMLFSFLWFLDAFVTAIQTRNRLLRQAEKARLLRETGWETIVENAQRDAWIGYAQSIALQLLLLPVGFYTWVWSPGESAAETEAFVGSSLLHTLFHTGMVSLSEVLRINFVRSMKRGALRLLGHQLRHPVKLVRTVTKITRWLRWVRIVGPVVGTSNKLLGNTMDLLKKIKQRRDAARAAQIRKILWSEMSQEEAMNYAATLIQKVYRAKRSRREFRALQLFRGDQERLAAIKLQRNLRAASMKAKLRLKQKKQELLRLHEKAKMAHANMSDKEKIRMYKLQADLAKEAEHFINRNLLRPSTTFSVAWRMIFVIAVVLELSALVLRVHNPKFGKESLFPTLYSDLKECQVHERGHWQKILSVFAKKDPKPSPWYCEDDMVALQFFGIALWRLVVDTTMLLVDFIFFFDVFVSFFTGELDPQTGVLTPKPFFVRWIAPGVVLQMCVNPHMDTIAEVLASSLSVSALRCVHCAS